MYQLVNLTQASVKLDEGECDRVPPHELEQRERQRAQVGTRVLCCSHFAWNVHLRPFAMEQGSGAQRVRFLVSFMDQ